MAGNSGSGNREANCRIANSAVALPPALCRPRAVEPPDLGTLLDMLSKYLPRFVLFSSDAQPIVLALWIAHAWAIEAFDVTPYPNISSAEKRSGKTQLLECLSYVVPKPWLTLSPSEAVLYRKTEKEGPTLLLDESDALFLKSGSDRQEYIRVYLILVTGAELLSPVAWGPTLNR